MNLALCSRCKWHRTRWETLRVAKLTTKDLINLRMVNSRRHVLVDEPRNAKNFALGLFDAKCLDTIKVYVASVSCLIGRYRLVLSSECGLVVVTVTVMAGLDYL